ncbi:MAG: alpha/beta hydrolase [Acidimicrobiales bacterium]|nr:alpha/beta hydrolase [Acidimicrobiales bacterium]
MLSSFAGGRLYGASYGDAPARVVALHGWGRTHADFAGVVEPFDAIAVDLPGFGSTPPPPDAWGSPEYAALIVELLRDLPAPPVLVGHSFGGRVGIHVAATAPDAIRGLVLTGAPLIRTGAAAKPKAGYRMARWLNRRGVLSDARMDDARKKYGSTDYANASPALRAIHVKLVNETYDAQIDAARGPIELVWGDDDTAAPCADELAARLGERANLTVIPGAGHLTPLTAGNELRAAINRVLA